MKPVYNQRNVMVGDIRTTVFSSAFGVASSDAHTISAFPVGSHIPGGRFVVNSPSYATGEFNHGSQNNRTAILPDLEGKNLFHNDRKTDYSDDIEDTLDSNGDFRFLGVSAYAGDTCKDYCEPWQCCPIGYQGIEQRNNYWSRGMSAMDIVTQGSVTVYAESAFNVNDSVHVRVRVTDADAVPCQQIGGVTAEPDTGTQPAGGNIRVDKNVAAGEAVLIELGGMSQ